MITSTSPHRRTRRLAGVAAALVLVAAACGTGGGGTVDGGGSGGGQGEVACAGPRHATSEGWVAPIADDPAPSLPTTVTDFTGEQVTVDDASRILALDTYGTLATTVYALGLGDRLVGRDVSTGVPELADLPVVTHNGHELNAEAILDLDPSVILTDYSIGPLEVQLQLEEAGIPVVILDSTRNRSVIGDQIRRVAEVLGVPEQGEQLASSVAADVAKAEDEVAAIAEGRPDLRMVFLYMRGNAGVYYWFGEGSGADDLIDALGGVDVAEEVGLEGSKPLNAEGLVKSSPDLYLMMTHGLESVGGVDGLLEVPGVADTGAGVDGCVVDMSDYEILSFGPQFPSTLRALGAAIYGDDGVLSGAGAPSS
ncbi:heme/hemin ABC transporter substrate-binding protein [Dermatobacter hominis]|uniref:heme/hemin ABC transporter substrate-binding protein n=1 Tax=Dermatobacter hominis TaxID=2884263 RepID=UPI001D108FAF|nr:ABC transporter substrate-binding protein [Dermatobacter hominis]UDY35925.1 ABC transporter substrate-binding protein [Dermatobacter hominis]